MEIEEEPNKNTDVESILSEIVFEGRLQKKEYTEL